MSGKPLRYCLLVGLVLLTGCVGNTPRPAGLTGLSSPTPQAVGRAGTVDPSLRMLWGGVILNVENRADSTLLEILAYPLDDDGRPMLDEAQQGRFLALHDDFLEPRDFAQGREVTLAGHLRDLVLGRVGKSDYEFPRLEVRASHLWPKQAKGRTFSRQPRVNLGVGVGSHGGGIGIGLGF